MNTTYTLTLNDGKTIKLSTNFALLYKFRAEHKDMYNKYIRIKNNFKKADDLDACYVIYIGYRCANPEINIEYEKFLELVPPDTAIIYELFIKLIAPSQMNKGFRPGVSRGNKKNKR